MEHSAEGGERLTPKDIPEKREAAIQGLMAKGYTRDRSEELIGLLAASLFAPGKRFGPPLPLHRTEAGYPHCSTCEGGGCPDCTDAS